MYKVDGNSIMLTRGDSFYAEVGIYDAEGHAYEVQSGDVIKFGLKQSTKESTCLIEKTIDNNDLILYLSPEDTKELPFGNYVYDIEITFANGDVDTFINGASFQLKAEVV